MCSMDVDPQLQSTDIQLRTLLDAAVDGIIVINQDGKIVTFNHAAEKMFGYAADEVMGCSVNLLMPEPHRSAHDGYLHAYKSTGKARIIGIGREVLGRHKDGSTLPLYISVGESHIDDSWCFVGILHDLTQRKRIEMELQEHKTLLTHAARLNVLGEMTAGIAHEVNQPLTAIATYAEVCRRMLDSVDSDMHDLKDTLRLINQQAIRAGDVTQRLRNLAVKQDNERSETDINELIDDVVKLSAADARIHNITLLTELDSMLPPVVVDVIEIQQVLLNLINNSIDVLSDNAMGDKTVTIRSRLFDDSTLQVLVEDNGSGISQHMQEKLFEPFSSSKAYGMGIGLSISRSIIHAHGGNLSLIKTSPQGTVFGFSLPLISENLKVTTDDNS